MRPVKTNRSSFPEKKIRKWVLHILNDTFHQVLLLIWGILLWWLFFSFISRYNIVKSNHATHTHTFIAWEKKKTDKETNNQNTQFNSIRNAQQDEIKEEQKKTKHWYTANKFKFFHFKLHILGQSASSFALFAIYLFSLALNSVVFCACIYFMLVLVGVVFLLSYYRLGHGVLSAYWNSFAFANRMRSNLLLHCYQFLGNFHGNPYNHKCSLRFKLAVR